MPKIKLNIKREELESALHGRLWMKRFEDKQIFESIPDEIELIVDISGQDIAILKDETKKTT